MCACSAWAIVITCGLTDDLLWSRDRRLYHRLIGKARVAARAPASRHGREAALSPGLDIQGVFGVREPPDWLERLIQAHYRALWRYTLRPFPGKVILIRFARGRGRARIALARSHLPIP